MLLQLKNLNVHYKVGKTDVKAVNQVNLVLREGDRLGIVGESGCGKSTLAYSILRLLAGNAQISGEILYKGQDLVSMAEDELNRIRWNKISIVFQNSMTALNPVTKIGKQIIDALMEHQQLSKDEALNRAETIVSKVGIPSHRLMEYPHEYSGGMKQRAVLALALICHPEILIADEPTTALDVVAQRQILQLFRELQNEMNLSIVVISHDISAISEISNQIAVMYAGEVMEYGPTKEVFIHSSHPYTKALVGSFPSLHRPLQQLVQIKGMTPSLSDLPEGCPFSPRCVKAKEICYAAHPMMKEVRNGVQCCCHYPEVRGAP